MKTPYWILAIVAFVGLLDVGTGLFLLLSEHPGTVNGAGTLWDTAPALVPAGDATTLTASLFKRVGALTMHAGVVALVVTWIGRANPRLLAGYMLVCMVDGLALNYVDRTFFPGTAYLAFKYAIGVAWPLGFGVLVWRLRNADGRDATG